MSGVLKLIERRDRGLCRAAVLNHFFVNPV